MIPSLIQIDNFLDNIDNIREEALKLEYVAPTGTKGWKGFRCLDRNELTIRLTEIIKTRLGKVDSKFTTAEYDCYFHYTLKDTVKDRGYNGNRIHRDNKKDYAGVLYLAPYFVPSSGTAFYDDNYVQIAEVENNYNRFVCYPANTLHSLQEPFGTSIENGRLTFTVFIEFKQKQSKTLI
jgi:hypothetical protein